MKENLFYWGPFLDRDIGTKKAIFNSALSINKYSKKFNSKIINTIGEWDNEEKNNLVKYINLNNKIFEKLPKYSFVKSRVSFSIIFFKCFWQLKKLLNEKKPKYLIIHLMTSIPFVLFLIFDFKTKILFRVSGRPKLNFLRKFLWKISNKNIAMVFCNTAEQKKELISKNIFPENKVKVLYDPVYSIENVLRQRRLGLLDSNFKKNNIIMVGRLTKQKNFEIFIKASEQLYKKDLLKFNTYIFGHGEDKEKLEELIKKLQLEKKIFLMGSKKNIHKYYSQSKLFILTSLWEDPGFVLIEAILNDLPIISSNCKNGPNEILKGNDGGILFENNNIDDLRNKMIKFLNLSEREINKKKIISKKNIKKYSLFRHFKLLENYISSNSKL
ncbi:glycosyltransferase [Candidatus Pelagibacter sp.]|uniref:glycosyltransferase n=1 Tax=Candidatus Pelagibacter sp. TaxID=2024849 RepID=UPI003F87AE52